MESIVYEWARYLTNEGFDATVLIPDTLNRGMPLRRDADDIEERYYGVPKKSIKNNVLRYGFVHKTNFYTGLPKGDVVFFPITFYDYLPNMFAKPRGQKYIMGNMGMTLFPGSHMSSEHQFLEGIQRIMIKRAIFSDKEKRSNIFFHVINQRQKQHLIEQIGIDKSKIFHIPAHVDTSAYHLGVSDSNDLKVVHIGGKGKNAQLLVDVIKALIANGKIDGLKFYFIGREEPQELFNYVGKTSNVSYLGYISDAEKIEILAKSDVLVIPDHNEAFAKVMLEGLASGLALLVDSWNPVIASLISDGAFAYTGIVGDQKSYADALIRLAEMKRSDAKAFEQGKKKNRNLAVIKFDEKVVFKLVKEMFLAVSESND